MISNNVFKNRAKYLYTTVLKIQSIVLANSRLCFLA